MDKAEFFRGFDTLAATKPQPSSKTRTAATNMVKDAGKARRAFANADLDGSGSVVRRRQCPPAVCCCPLRLTLSPPTRRPCC